MYDMFMNCKSQGRYDHGMVRREQFIGMGGVHYNIFYNKIYLSCSYGINPYNRGLSRGNIDHVKCFDDCYLIIIDRHSRDYILMSISDIVSDLREKPVEEIEIGSLFFFK